MAFLELLRSAQEGNESAQLKLLDMYAPMLYKGAVLNGRLDEDLLQELRITFLNCVRRFKIE